METEYIAGQTAGQVNPEENYRRTAELIDYVPRSESTSKVYSGLGFKCGLEIHQQLLTKGKLFCRCPAGLYQEPDDFDAELIRHMRPTLSEMGEYDGTALMEKKTKKNIFYRIKDESACTYDIDDTPPFKIDREALEISIEVALLLKTNIVGELHITRKQYLDGSIPTGFQRTAIVGIEGAIPLANKTVRIIQISIEEDSCREVSDIRHNRIYTTDRLGMPLIETVTYPDMLTPDEAAEAAHYLRYLVRSTGHVRTGIGAARQDVNVSIDGGTRIEIKGVSHIKWIPELTHNEMFRQAALLRIRDILNHRVEDPAAWTPETTELSFRDFQQDYPFWRAARERNERIVAVNLPKFKGIPSFFTQPGHDFGSELSGRVKVIACLERPNLLTSEMREAVVSTEDWGAVRRKVQPGDDDAQVIVWGPAVDVDTAIETIEERCRMAFEGVPGETRKSLPDGTTIFERVLPGPDRMYPDTDSAPLPIPGAMIERLGSNLPTPVCDRMAQLKQWRVPPDTYAYILSNNLVPLMERIISDFDVPPDWIGKLLGHDLKHLEGTLTSVSSFSRERIYGLVGFVAGKKLQREIIRELLPILYSTPSIDYEKALGRLSFKRLTLDEILAEVPELVERFSRYRRATHPDALIRWLMGELRPLALGNVDLGALRKQVEKEVR